MYYYPDLIVSNLFYHTCTIRADVSAPCACLSCSLAFLLLYVVFLSKYMMMMILVHRTLIGQAPDYITNLLTRVTDIPTRSSLRASSNGGAVAKR